MAALDDILRMLPVDQIAGQVGAQPQQVEQAAAAALPALIGGMQANAQTPGGAASLLEALGQHAGRGLLDGGVDAGQVDTQDGMKIANHIFGGNTEAVVNQLGSLGGGQNSGLIARLLPILAPIVMSYVAKQMAQGSGGGLGQGSNPFDQAQQSAPAGQGGSDILSQVLGSVLQGGQATSQAAPAGVDTGSIVTNVLGGLLGGGRR